MKYNINIPQKTILDNNLGIDLIDAAILNIIFDMPSVSGIEKKHENNMVFFWVNHLHLAKENPILGIKTADGIYRRLSKLSSIGLIHTHPDNKKNRRSFYAISDYYISLFVNDTKYVSDKNKEVNIGFPSDVTSVSHPNITSDGKPKDYSISNDYSINDYNNLNIKAEIKISADNPQLDFGDDFKKPEPEAKKKTKEKKVAHPSFQPIKKYWFEEFRKGERFHPASGKWINEIILNIEAYLKSKNGDLSPETVVEFFKHLCLEKMKVRSTYISASGLKEIANDFMKIVDTIIQNSKNENTNGRTTQIDTSGDWFDAAFAEQYEREIRSREKYSGDNF